MIWMVAAVLVLWAAIVTLRRKREAAYGRSPASLPPEIDPDIDREELERAEREVRDLDTDAKGRPLDDVVGDDWGPGTPKPPYT
jgi:hypothetical protein